MSIVYERLYDIVRRIPEGRVATYAQIARLLGPPYQARQVGYALTVLRGNRAPWETVFSGENPDDWLGPAAGGKS